LAAIIFREQCIFVTFAITGMKAVGYPVNDSRNGGRFQAGRLLRSARAIRKNGMM
jgi:hypothetical protein